MQLPSKKTKIICTIGPASQSREILESLISGGMDVARLNFAHGTFESHAKVIETIRAASAAVGRRVAIMADLPGPKMRIGRLAMEPIQLKGGQSFILQSEPVMGNSKRVSVSFPELPQAVTPGDSICINDGFIQVAVESTTDTEVQCIVEVGGELRSHKGLNLPGIDLGISAFTEQDHEFLRFAREQGLDAVSQSFVQNAADIEAVRQAAAAMDYQPFIIAKIERAGAVDNIEEILEASDGVMVARGDLGVEIPIEEIAVVQKHLIRHANLKGKPVITATHMLESMTTHNRPTRAEATDVANAIFDGTDCVMLSGETAAGQFPVESVAVMARIAEVAEDHADHNHVPTTLNDDKALGKISTPDLISLSVCLSAEALNPVAIMTPTLSGGTPRAVTRFRLPAWIVAVSPDHAACQHLQFSHGVYPVHEKERPATWEAYARGWMASHGVSEGLLLLTKGTGVGTSGGTNQIEIIDLSVPPSDVNVW